MVKLASQYFSFHNGRIVCHLNFAPNIESIAKFGKAADCKSVTVGSNPTTFILVNFYAKTIRYLLVVFKIEK